MVAHCSKSLSMTRSFCLIDVLLKVFAVSENRQHKSVSFNSCLIVRHYQALLGLGGRGGAEIGGKCPSLKS